MMIKPASFIELSFGGLGFHLSCDDPELAERLRSRYAAFPLEAEAQYHGKIHVLPGGGVSQLAGGSGPGLEFRAGVAHFTAAGYRGFVDPAQGEISFASDYPEEEVEYFLRVAAALVAFESGGLMFHAAGVAREGQAYLFFGHSGAGKTTAARNSPDAQVLNDDLVLLMPEAWGWNVYATPFWNPSQVRPSACSARLAGIYRLVQSPWVALEPMGNGQALAEVVSNVPVIPLDAGRSLELLERGRRLLAQVPAQRLHLLPDASFWGVILPASNDH